SCLPERLAVVTQCNLQKWLLRERIPQLPQGLDGSRPRGLVQAPFPKGGADLCDQRRHRLRVAQLAQGPRSRSAPVGISAGEPGDERIDGPTITQLGERRSSLPQQRTLVQEPEERHER